MADVGDITAKLTLDTQGFSEGVSGIQGMAEKLASGVGGALGSVASAVGAGVAAAAAAVGKLVTDSVTSFGQFEQLVGGAQKIFDQMDFSQIAADASNAWMTMNLSANQYLEMINQIGATLASTMGDQAGYEAAKAGMQAIADYASGTGRSVDELSQKFALITRSAASYQSIADQFSGILPQTSNSFLEQAQAAGLLSTSYEKLTDVPLAEYQQAVITMLTQGVDALSLTGNAAAESTSTITGSINALKAAWANLVTGLADSSADLGALFSNVASQAEIAFQQILPAVSTALNGLGQLIADVAPLIAAEIPNLLSTVAPMLLEAAVSIVDTLIAALPGLVNSITNSVIAIIPQFVSALISTLDALITSVIPAVLEVAIALVLALGQGIAENANQIIGGLLTLVDVIVNTIVANLPAILEVGLQIVVALVTALVENEGLLIGAIADLVVGLTTAVIQSAPAFIEAGVKIVVAIATGILTAIPRLIGALGQALGIVDGATRSVGTSLTGMVSDVGAASTSIDATLGATVSSVNAHSSNINSIGNRTVSIAQANTASIESSAASAERAFSVAYEEAVRTSEGFKKSVDDTNEWVKETTVKIYDGNGEVVDSFETTTMTIKSEVDTLNGISKQGQEYIKSAMESISDSADNAADNVDNAVDRMNSSLGRLSGGSIDISARAGGGPVQAGVPYMTGEEGRELFVPRTDGYILNHDDTEDFLSENARGEAIVININGDVYDNARSMRQKMRSAVLGIMQEQVAYG